MRWPLRYQILLPFAGAMLLVVIGVTLLDAYLAAGRTQRQIERQLNEVAQTLLDANFPLTDSVLRQTRGLSGAEFVLTDQKGKVLSSSWTENVVPPPATSDVGHAEIRLGDVVEVRGEEYFHNVVPLRPRAGDGGSSLLHIMYPRAALREARWQAAYPPLLLGSLLLAVVVVAAFLIAARFSRPIVQLRKQLGTLAEGNFRAIPLPARNDELRDLVISVNSLAEQLETLKTAIKRAERLTLLGQLSGGLAHQLRNSATGARLAVQLHGRQCREIAQDCLQVALRQLSMTESHLARFLAAGQAVAPHQRRCDPGQWIDDIQALVGPSLAHWNVTLSCDIADELPELWGDEEQLRQLLLNLALNGIEAAGPGGWLRIELAARDNALIVHVLDSGSGPPAEIVERLFEPFVTGKPEGIGLGLAVAAQIAEAHGGRLHYLQGDVTCFEVTLPAQPRTNFPVADDPGDAIDARDSVETVVGRCVP